MAMVRDVVRRGALGIRGLCMHAHIICTRVRISVNAKKKKKMDTMRARRENVGI